MSGVLARLVAQAVVFTAGVLGRAFQEAYVKAQQQGRSAAGGAQKAAAGASSAAASAGSAARMASDQARQVLNLEKADVTLERVMEAFAKHHALNDPDTNGGSLYVQTKIFNAKEALVADLREERERKRKGRTAAAAASEKLR